MLQKRVEALAAGLEALRSAPPAAANEQTRPDDLAPVKSIKDADASKGRIRAEITDYSERTVLKGRSRDESVPLSGDGLDSELRWQGSDGMRDLRGQVVRIRFYIENADLYSFWLKEGN